MTIAHPAETAFLLALVLSAGAMARAEPAPAPPSDAQVGARVEALLGQMTLEEKIGQLSQAGGISFDGGPSPEEALRKGGAGSVLWVNDSKRFNALQKLAVEESRLKIPVIFGLDVIHGYRTIFPIPIGMASSWDPSVEERAAEIAAREARAVGIHWTFAPMVDIARDARWGRIAEGAGEDPYLGAAMAAARCAAFRGPTSALPTGCWRAPSTLRPMARPTAGATTIPSTSPRPSSGTCTSRPSTRPPKRASARS